MNIKHILMVGIAATGMIAASSANAATTIVNGSFENGTAIPSGSFVTIGAGGSGIDGWTVGGGGVDYIGTYWQAADGTRSIDLSGNSNGSISQALDTVIGQQYQVTFSLAGNPDGGTGVKVAVTSIGGSLPQIDFFNVGPANTHADMGWQTFTYTFTAFDTTSLLTFASGNNPNSAYGPAIDNVSIAAVPEPATWGLMLVGFGMMGVAVRRRNVRTTVRFA